MCSSPPRLWEKLMNMCEFMLAEVSVEQHAVCRCYDLMFVPLTQDIGATDAGMNKLEAVVDNQSDKADSVGGSVQITVWKSKEIQAYTARKRLKMCCCLKKKKSFHCYLTFNNPSVLGHEKPGKDKGAKNVLVMSSKAKGIDRLTGRARRSVTAKPQRHQQHNSMMLLLMKSSGWLSPQPQFSMTETHTVANKICKGNVGILIDFLALRSNVHSPPPGCHEAWFRSCCSWPNNPEVLFHISLLTALPQWTASGLLGGVATQALLIISKSHRAGSEAAKPSVAVCPLASPCVGMTAMHHLNCEIYNLLLC